MEVSQKRTQIEAGAADTNYQVTVIPEPHRSANIGQAGGHPIEAHNPHTGSVALSTAGNGQPLGKQAKLGQTAQGAFLPLQGEARLRLGSSRLMPVHLGQGQRGRLAIYIELACQNSRGCLGQAQFDIKRTVDGRTIEPSADPTRIIDSAAYIEASLERIRRR